MQVVGPQSKNVLVYHYLLHTIRGYISILLLLFLSSNKDKCFKIVWLNLLSQFKCLWMPYLRATHRLGPLEKSFISSEMFLFMTMYYPLSKATCRFFLVQTMISVIKLFSSICYLSFKYAYLSVMYRMGPLEKSFRLLR